MLETSENASRHMISAGRGCEGYLGMRGSLGDAICLADLLLFSECHLCSQAQFIEAENEIIHEYCLN